MVLLEEEEMKKPFDILRYRYVAMGASGLFILAGIILFFVLGFNTGIDFGAGYSERVSIAPAGLTVSYSGEGTAVLSVDSRVLTLTIRTPEGVEEHALDPALYPTTDDIARELEALGCDTALISSEKTGRVFINVWSIVHPHTQKYRAARGCAAKRSRST